MPKYSGGSIKTALANLSSSRGAYVSRNLGKVFAGKISHPVFGTQRVSDALKKTIDKKTAIEIFNKAKEAKGVLRETQGTKSESEFLKQVAKQEKIDKIDKITAQIEQKNSAANKPVAAQNQGVKKSLPADDKQAKQIQKEQKSEKIKWAQKETAKAERWRGAALGGGEAIRGMERVYARGEKYRKQQAATSGLLKSRGGGGMAAEGKSGGLVDHAVKEEEKSDSSNKSSQKKGSNAPAGQKSSGHQPVKLQDSAGIDQLTHRQEIAKGENLPGGVFHVEGLDKAPVSPPETPPAPRSASAPEDITDLDIG